MFLPIGDEPNPRQRPVMTYALIAVNVAVFVFISLPLMGQPVDLGDPLLPSYLEYMSRLMGRAPRFFLGEVSAYDLFTFRHGFQPAAPEVLDLFTAMFLHGGFMHLLGNMLFLYIFGDNVEARLGRLAFLATYLTTGAVATAFFALFEQGSLMPLVGASGAISGVLGLYFVWFPHNRVRLFVWLFWLVDVWRVPARLVLGAYLILDNLLPFFVGGSGGVAYGAHIGGFVGGAGIALAMERRGRRVSRTYESGPSIIFPEDELRVAMRQGDWRRAGEVLEGMSDAQRSRLDEMLLLTMAEGLGAHGEQDAALRLVQRFIATRPQSRLLPEAHLQAGLLQLAARKFAAARQHFLAVLDHDAAESVHAAARRGLEAAADG